MPFSKFKYFQNVFYISNNQNTKYPCKSILNTSTSTSGRKYLKCKYKILFMYFKYYVIYLYFKYSPTLIAF